jgi:2-keto-4-pentenoate hydratase/2-oxohepta-3-ene-1,7-dioic acid hydratase in catechol pathway
MSDTIRLFRRREGDLLRSGRTLLEVDGRLYDLTEELWQASDPLLISALCARGWFEPTRFDIWLERANMRSADPLTPEDVLLPPLLPVEVGKILALGKNFHEHAAEFREEVPTEPLFFNKLPETMRGHNQPVAAPPGYEGRLDHEVELAVVIGRRARRVSEAEAHEHIAGYCVANDLTLRSLQGADREKRHPWFRSKNFDGACPMGPCFVPATHFHPTSLEITAHVNGELRQSASSDDMVVSIPRALSFLSQHVTLNPGDIVLMGTPAGVGPLVPGDEVVCAISGIGELRTRIEREA